MNHHDQTGDARAAQGWSDEMLERLIDGEVIEEVASALRDELRRNPDARRELAEIRRTDALAADIFDGLVEGRMSRVAEVMDVYQRRAMRRILAGAACVAILIVGAFALGRMMTGASPAPGPDSRLADATPEELIAPSHESAIEISRPDSRRAARIVFEMPVRPKHLAPGAEVPGVTTEPERLAQSPASTPEPRAESARERERRYLAIGRTLRSADVAKQTLDAMPESEQLEACRVWARDPALRPVTFERLARLQDDPALAGECARIASEMSDDSHLLAWARSHGLRTTAPTHQ